MEIALTAHFTLDLSKILKPVPGSVWKHKKGGVYSVLFPQYPHPELGDVVVYIAQGDAHDAEYRVCYRPVAEFLDGRFTKIADTSAPEDCGIKRG
jgi:hypothetical protein